MPDRCALHDVAHVRTKQALEYSRRRTELSSTRAGSEKRSKRDLYVTPYWCISPLAEEIKHYVTRPEAGAGLFMLDPGAGDGRIGFTVSKALGIRHLDLVESDEQHLPVLIYSGRPGAVEYIRDFQDFAQGRAPGYDLIVSNPPFSEAQVFIEASLGLLGEGGIAVFLLNMNFLGGELRVPFWAAHPPAFMRVLAPRPSFTNGGNDSVDYAWMGWAPGREAEMRPFGWYHTTPYRKEIEAGRDPASFTESPQPPASGVPVHGHGIRSRMRSIFNH